MLEYFRVISGACTLKAKQRLNLLRLSTERDCGNSESYRPYLSVNSKKMASYFKCG